MTITSTGPFVDSSCNPSCWRSACAMDNPDRPESGGGGGIDGVVSSVTKSSCRSKSPSESRPVDHAPAKHSSTASGPARAWRPFPPCIRAPAAFQADAGRAASHLAGFNFPGRCHSSCSSPLRGRVRGRVHAVAFPGRRQLDPTFRGHQRIHRQFLRLAMCLQLEAVLKQRSQHEKHSVPLSWHPPWRPSGSARTASTPDRPLPGMAALHTHTA